MNPFHPAAAPREVRLSHSGDALSAVVLVLLLAPAAAFARPELVVPKVPSI